MAPALTAMTIPTAARAGPCLPAPRPPCGKASRPGGGLTAATVTVALAGSLWGSARHRGAHCRGRAVLPARHLRTGRRPRCVVAAFSNDEQLSAQDADYTLLSVPVRGGAHTIALKRFMETPSGDNRLPRLLPAVLIMHGGPGLPSRYLEPLATRLRRPMGRSVYMYDQLGCGLSLPEGGASPVGGYGMAQSVGDLRDVLRFLCERLGEAEVHLMGHDFGGALVMEGLLRGGLWTEASLAWPLLRSVCLIGAPSSTLLAEAEARRLMRKAETEVGMEDAAKSFWYRHNCALKPQPACLKEAYLQASSPEQGWRSFGALQGWEWSRGRWELRGSGVLQDWEIRRREVARCYVASKTKVSFLSIRGEHDFVTESCVEAWRGVLDALEAGEVDQQRPSSTTFREEVIHGCGHNAHLEDPETFAALVRLWLLDVEDVADAAGAEAQRASTAGTESSAVVELDKFQLLGRTEARQQLLGWASELSWCHARGPKQGPVRAVGQGLPHRDMIWPSRSVRRLAEWARNLPSVVADTAPGVDGVRQALRTCVGGAGAVADRSVNGRMAVGVVEEGAASLKVIVCLEVGERDLDGPRVVGAVTAPGVSPTLKQAVTYQMQELIGEVVGSSGAGAM